MISIMFPGQPMSMSEIPADCPLFQKISSQCRKITGFDIILNMAPADNLLTDSLKLQLYGISISLYNIELLVQQGIKANIIAEHSMGIYAAIAASGAVDSDTAIELTVRIGKALAGMKSCRNYAFGSVVGIAENMVLDIARNNQVYLANYNTSKHFLLSGEESLIESAMTEALAAGAFSANSFATDAPLHTPLIEGIRSELQEIVADYSFKEPLLPLMNHFDQSFLTAAKIPVFLVEELTKPVFWSKSYRALLKQGVSIFKELGAGMALTKFNRWIDSET